MTDRHPPTATSIAADVRAGRLTARQAVEDALSRIEDIAHLDAFQVVRTFEALREADEVDRRPDRAELPLAGVPVAVKDNVPVAGEPMRIGTKATDPTPQTVDHEVVRRLRSAGAVVVGLTTVPELCIFGTTDSVFGVTRNPWDPDRTPGGSSGGSAAAVASGAVPIAHGNDGMGSVRIPAACCGLVGVKPGAGVVPSELGHESWFGMAENGALATTVEDAALLLSVLADRPGLTTGIETGALRIAVSTAVPMSGVRLTPEWASAARAASGTLAAEGHSVVSADPPYGQLLGLSEMARWAAGSELDARLVADRTLLTTRTRRHAALGRLLLRAGFPKERGRRRWLTRAERFFADYDVLVTPTLARRPVRAIAWSERGWLPNLISNAFYAPFAAPWNVAGWPAMSVPAGLDSAGMPLAVQLVGKPGSEAQLLAVAAQLERSRPWIRTAPSVSGAA